MKRKRIAVATHVFATGPAQELEAFLRPRSSVLIFVGHPLYKEEKLPSLFKFYERGSLLRVRKAVAPKLPGPLCYILDLFRTVRWGMTCKGRCDVFVGANPLNALAGLVLRFLGKVRKVVLYTIDYDPRRFDNPVMNRLYHSIDRFCVARCDLTWNLSSRMAGARENMGLSRKYRPKQVVVPLGIDAENVRDLPPEEINRYEIVYMGHLRERQGIERIIDAMPDILRKVPDARLLIIGKGHLMQPLSRRASELGLADRVHFKGYMEDHARLLNRLARCAVGVAPYVDDSRTYTRFADPGKPKAYLSAGLPVIITRLPEVWKEIEAQDCGIAIGQDREELASALAGLLQDEERLFRMKENTRALVERYRWDKVFESAFGELDRSENAPRIGGATTGKGADPILDYRKTVLAKTGLRLLQQDCLLEVGCGKGDEACLLSERAGFVLGVDVRENENWKRLQGPGIRFCVQDVRRLAIRENSFDTIFAKDVLHHVWEPDKALKEMKRVTRPGGTIVIIEANRYNPLFFLHMTLLLGHDHFTGAHFRALMGRHFESVRFKTIESRVYPTKSRLLLGACHRLERSLESTSLFGPILAYNIAYCRNDGPARHRCVRRGRSHEGPEATPIQAWA